METQPSSPPTPQVLDYAGAQTPDANDSSDEKQSTATDVLSAACDAEWLVPDIGNGLATLAEGAVACGSAVAEGAVTVVCGLFVMENWKPTGG